MSSKKENLSYLRNLPAIPQSRELVSSAQYPCPVLSSRVLEPCTAPPSAANQQPFFSNRVRDRRPARQSSSRCLAARVSCLPANPGFQQQEGRRMSESLIPRTRLNSGYYSRCTITSTSSMPLGCGDKTNARHLGQISVSPKMLVVAI